MNDEIRIKNGKPAYFNDPTQVAFIESDEIVDEPQWIGGIAFQSYIICGECGGVIDLKDVEDIRVMPWISISEDILGDEAMV